MASMTFDVTASDRASRELDKVADSADKVRLRLEKLDKARAQPDVQLNIAPATAKLQQLQSRLDALRNVRAEVEVTGAEQARRDVTALVVELRKVRDVRAKVDLGTGSAKQDVREIVRQLSSLRDQDVRIDVDSGGAQQEVDSIRARAERLQALSPVTVRVEVDDQATAQLDAIFGTASVIDGLDPALRVDADTARAAAQLEAVLAQLERIGTGTTTARVQLDSLTFLGQLARVQQELNTLSGGKVRLDADTQRLMVAIAEVRTRLAELAAMDASPKVDADTAAARAELMALERQLAGIAGRRYNANVDVDTGASMAKVLSLSGVVSGLGSAAGSVRPRVAALTTGILILAEAGIAASGALGAIPGILAGLAAAGTAVGMGFTGIGDAFKAIKSDQEAMASAAAKSGSQQVAQASAIRAALRGVEDAQRQAARTAEQGAQSIADAARGVEDAQRRAAEVAVDGAARVEEAQRRAAQVAVDGARQIGDAQRAVADAQQAAVERTASAEAQLERALVSRRDAQESLTRAVRDAREAQEDLALSLRGAALSEEGALIALERARERLANMPADSTALDYREAELAVRRAALAIDESRERHIDLQQESARSAQAGIDGADGVVAAQRRVQDANRGVLDAESGVSRAREEGARSVARAQEALARTQESVARANEDAIRGVAQAQQSAARANADAQRDVQRAQEQLGRAQVDAARANEDASRQVARAQEALAEAYQQTGSEGVAAAMKSEAALAKLSPEARRFVEAVLELRPAWAGVRAEVQDSMFRGVADDMRELSDAQLPGVRDGLVRVAGGLNLGVRGFADLLTSARGVEDVKLILDESGRGAEAYGKSLTPITGMFLDIAAVGSPILSELAEEFLISATNAEAFIAKARESGDLDDWIRGGMTELQQLGTLLVNSGEVVVRTFDLADEAGIGLVDTLVRITGGMRDYLRTAEGQDTVRRLFEEIDAAADAALPGVSALAQGVADVGGGLADSHGLERFTTGASDLAKVVEPLGSTLGYIGGTALGMIGDTAGVAAGALQPVVAITKGILDFMGPLAPALVTTAAGFLLLRPVAGIMAGAGAALSGAALGAGVWTEKATRSADAGTKVASGMDRVGGAISKASAALPLVGAAVIGLIALYEEFGSAADESAQKVLTGSMSVEQAMAREIEQVEKNQLWWNSATQQQDAHADARRRVQEEIDRQFQLMGPMEQLQARVAMAQTELNDAVARGAEESPAARAAADELSTAQGELERAQEGAARLTRDHTQAMIDQADQARAIADTNLRYLDSLDRIQDAEKAAADAVRDHGAGSREAEAANRDLIRAHLDTATAAREKAEADATATGIGNAAQLGAQAYKDELIRLAGQAKGPTRQALLDMANGVDLTRAAESTAEVQARLHKDELGRLAGQATGPVRAAMLDARDRFNELGGASATAETRARLQKDELLRLAQMASGPLRTELTNMANQIRTLPSGSFTVTASGYLGPITETGVRVQGGTITRAAGGVLPGWTPGRDVHSFYSATAGQLELSGGEAVMRPEWTRAVGREFIDTANAAARRGGVAGVTNFLSRTAPRASSMEGRAGDGSRFASGGVWAARPQRLALGGVVRTGPQPFTAISTDRRVQTRDEITRRLQARLDAIQAARRRYAAEQAAAAAAGGGGAASGPVTAGAAAGLRWARTQVGKPYIWAGVGPRGYDCSGFMSAIVNVMRGRNPHTRIGATGSFPWAGFRPGIGPGLSIGSFRGSPGHMAGTIDGVNVESKGSAGVPVGPAARGAGHSMFTTRAHLFDRGGRTAGRRGLLVKDTLRPERMLSPRQTVNHERLTSVLDRATTRRGLAGSTLSPRLDVAAQVRAAVEQGLARLAVDWPAPPAVSSGVDRAAVAALDRAVSALAGRAGTGEVVAELQGLRADLSRSGPSVAVLAQERRTFTELGAY